jgi:hypothetical protein
MINNENLQELKRLNSPKINDPMKKLGKEMHIAFSQEEVQNV